MIPLDEAVATVLAGCAPLPPRRLSVSGAGGCVLAAAVSAGEAIPPFANTAMDGYAVRAADVAAAPVELPVVAEVAAGHPTERSLATGEAMRIFTGAPMPVGADAVVMVERTRRVADGERVVIEEGVEVGTHIRPAGDDVAPGDQVAGPGDELTPARVGLLGALGVDRVEAHPRPWVGVVSTGDELVSDAAPLGPGQIRDSNRPMLLGLLVDAGFKPVDMGHVPDDEAAIAEVIGRAAMSCDALITTGGVSMGDTDLVKVVLDRLSSPSVPMRWMQVAIKPAKPFAFGVVGSEGRTLPVFGLPGNPVSALVSFELLARPGLRQLAGHPQGRLRRAPLRGVAVDGISRRSDGKVHFVRVRSEVVEGELRVRPVTRQGSHQIAGMADADALAVVPDGPGVSSGGPVDVLLLNA